MSQTAACGSVTVTVELFGVARMKAGVSHVPLLVEPRASVAMLIRSLAMECPGLIGHALQPSDNGAIAVAEGYALNRNGLAFLSADQHDQADWTDGDALLLLSNQAGG